MCSEGKHFPTCLSPVCMFPLLWIVCLHTWSAYRDRGQMCNRTSSCREYRATHGFLCWTFQDFVVAETCKMFWAIRYFFTMLNSYPYGYFQFETRIQCKGGWRRIWRPKCWNEGTGMCMLSKLELQPANWRKSVEENKKYLLNPPGSSPCIPLSSNTLGSPGSTLSPPALEVSSSIRCFH